MMVPGVALFFAGIAYYLVTKDTADGDFRELRREGRMAGRSAAELSPDRCISVPQKCRLKTRVAEGRPLAADRER